MPDVRGIVTKTDYNAKTRAIEKNLLTIIMKNILLFQNLVSLQQKFAARLVEANLI